MIVLDTHALIWWASGDNALSVKARKLKSVSLPGEFHKDPADRMIVATARKLSAPLVTRDEKIRAYKHVKTIW